MGGFDLFRGDARDAYPNWPAPATIISDGAYGVRGFHGDTIGSQALPRWYRPHIASWSAAAGPATTLWFWNTEIGWATVHPLLAESGWDYVQVITWGKGIAHIAGNVTYRGAFGYVTCILRDGEHIPLCRLCYGGSAHSFGFPIYSAAHDRHQDAISRTGLPAGTP